MCMPACLYGHHAYVGVNGGQKRVSDDLELEMSNSYCELFEVGAKNRLHILCKISQCSSPLSHLSVHLLNPDYLKITFIYLCACVCVCVCMVCVDGHTYCLCCMLTLV